MDQTRVDVIKNILYSDSIYFLNSKNFFFYAHSLEDSYIIHDHIDAPFLFLLQKDFYIAHKHIVTFCLFLLQKDFGTFCVLLFEAFLCFSDNSYLSFLYL